MIQNPILPGFHPDPSICRVGDDFYMVTSSFSFYPGVPIFHSRDLANWEQLGYVLNRPSQLPSGYQMLSGGIFAPTIRYHDGVYYMITTNMSMGFKNFIVTADRPEGPWSELHIIEGAEGIDPSLFFDDDGRAYYTGTMRTEETDGNSQAIWGCEIDLDRMELTGERRVLWRGAMAGAFAPEGPHLYKKDGWYYLMIAEGGTEHYHAVTVSRSREVLGKYEGYQGNPVLTHRHLGALYPVCNVGHGDLVELQDGSWYMVMLGSRLMGGYHKILGRETFLAPVEWEDGWPVVSPGTGRVEMQYPSPAGLKPCPYPKGALPLETDTDFTQEALGLEWNEIGNPKQPFYRLEAGCLKLKLLKNELVPWELDGLSSDVFQRIQEFPKESAKVCFLGRRQQHMHFQAETELDFSPRAGEGAGLAVLQNDANQLRLECRKGGNGEREAACVRVKTVIRDGKQYFEEETLGSISLRGTEGKVTLRITGNGVRYSFYAGEAGADCRIIKADADGSFLGSETAGGYIGAYIGLYAFGGEEEKEASFTRFAYKALEDPQGERKVKHEGNRME